jgi:hypothetical protein
MANTAPIKTITYMALMAALNVLFAFIASFIPMAGLFLVIALPLASALVALRVDLRFYPIYFMATLGLSLVVTLHQLETTIFYIFPALILGLVYGLLYRVKLSDGAIIILASFVQLGLLYVTIILIDAIFEVHFTASIQTILTRGSMNDVSLIMPAFLYVISLAQTIITYMIIGPEIEKLVTSVSNRPVASPWLYLSGLIIAVGIVPLGLLLPSISYIFLGPVIIVAGLAVYELVKERRFAWLVAGSVWLLLAVFLVAMLYPLMGAHLGLLLLSIIPLGFIGVKNCQLVFASRRVKS